MPVSTLADEGLLGSSASAEIGGPARDQRTFTDPARRGHVPQRHAQGRSSCCRGVLADRRRAGARMTPEILPRPRRHAARHRGAGEAATSPWPSARGSDDRRRHEVNPSRGRRPPGRQRRTEHNPGDRREGSAARSTNIGPGLPTKSRSRRYPSHPAKGCRVLQPRGNVGHPSVSLVPAGCLHHRAS